MPASCSHGLLDPGAIGGDLVWWRNSPALNTLVTLYGGPPDADPASFDSLQLQLLLFDASGNLHKRWTETLLRDRWLLVDSRSHAGSPCEGVLAIVAVPPVRASSEARAAFRRLGPLVDWFSDGGETMALHSDQALDFSARPQELTEVVFLESAGQRNLLVVLNGPQARPAKTLRFTARNAGGETRAAVYPAGMNPFSVHRIYLSDLFPGLADFCAGRAATLEGAIPAGKMYLRPYVVTEGARLGAYHGGDRYSFPALPSFVYRVLGHGEVNPMVAVHSGQVTTCVNILNSHGGLDDDFWVDARLFDEAGVLVAEKSRWLRAPRRGLGRGEIAELLPAGRKQFAGHVALNFTPDQKPLYPRHLQALLEYRSPVNAAHVMAWSDVWNARQELAQAASRLRGLLPLDRLDSIVRPLPEGAVLRAHQRAWCSGPIESQLAITNCGARRDYSGRARYRMRLRNLAGQELDYQGDLPPQGSDIGPVDRFFPNAAGFAAPEQVALVLLESRSDLAAVVLNRHRASGAVSAEHFMADATYRDGEYFYFCGS